MLSYNFFLNRQTCLVINEFKICRLFSYKRIENLQTCLVITEFNIELSYTFTHLASMICLPIRSMGFVWLNISFLCSCSTSLFVFWTLLVWPLYCLSSNLRLSSDYSSNICKLFLNIFWSKLSICTSIQTNLITYSGVQHVLTVYMSNLTGVL